MQELQNVGYVTVGNGHEKIITSVQLDGVRLLKHLHLM